MKKIAFFVLITMVIAGCSQGNKQKKESETPVSPLDNLRNAISSVRPEIHNSYSAAAYLELTGANYMPNLVNNQQNVTKYEDDLYVAAVNLGIYNMDVVYQAGYHEGEGALLSYGAAKTLAYKIGLGEIYDEIYLERIEAGISKEDSIVYKLSNVLELSKPKLTEKDQARLFGAIVIGANVEGMYILNHIIFNYNVDLPEEAKLQILRETIIVLKEQINEFEVLTQLFENYQPQSELGEKALKLMQETIATYNAVDLSDEIDTLEPNQIFENENLLKGFEQVKEIRKMLVLE